MSSLGPGGDRSLLHHSSPEKELYAGRLSAAGGPHERDRLARSDLQVETVWELLRAIYL